MNWSVCTLTRPEKVDINWNSELLNHFRSELFILLWSFQIFVSELVNKRSFWLNHQTDRDIKLHSEKTLTDWQPPPPPSCYFGTLFQKWIELDIGRRIKKSIKSHCPTASQQNYTDNRWSQDSAHFHPLKLSHFFTSVSFSPRLFCHTNTFFFYPSLYRPSHSASSTHA